jgi:superfamily II DNA or RNA helicase
MGDSKLTVKFRDIAAVDERLAEIDAERRALLSLKDQLQSHGESSASAHLTADQKISIFKNLFRGRQEVFATRWENSKGKSGYAVACANEWVPGTCHKPNISCQDCSNRQFTELSDQAIYKHLSGQQTVGLYPLLQDNTCYLLAMDFDKSDWREAAKAVAAACNDFNVPHTIEISRSGNGAHIWFFFEDKVPAKKARSLGAGLLDKAMEAYPQLSFESYDRLFPNQDVLPEGGFGNLIALPLQREPRLRGNTVFVDSDLEPFEDQWEHLSQVRTIATSALLEIVSDIGPRPLDNDGAEVLDELPPWEQTANLKPLTIENPSEEVTVTLANQVYFDLSELPAPLVTRLKRLASFSNPVFFKTQALRFSTHGIPRFVSCARVEQGYLSLPRGCLDDALMILGEHGMQKVTFDDHREDGQQLKDAHAALELRANQRTAVNTLIKHDTGILHAPTAFGKTVTAIAIIAKRQSNTLILTHNRQLLDQWQERIKLFMPDAQVGVIGGGKNRPTYQIDIATYQSLINKKDNTIDPRVQQYGHVIVDECHHVSAPRFEMVLNEVRAKYVLGLTATPDRQDGHQKIMLMALGPIRHKGVASTQQKLTQQVIVTELWDRPPLDIVESTERPRISDVYRWLVDNRSRTDKIVEDVVECVAQSRHPLILTERREHAERIQQCLSDRHVDSVVLRGGMGSAQRKSVEAKIPSGQVIVATGKYIGEGFDLPRLDTLFLAMPIAWKGSLAQYAGRIHRESAGKERVTIYDYVDTALPMLRRMYRKREKAYQAMGYLIEGIGQTQSASAQDRLFD